MAFRPFGVPDEMFDLLAAGGGGAGAVRHLAAGQRGKHLVLVWGVMDMARRFRHPQAAQARRGWELLVAIEEQAPGGVESVLCYPSAGAWATGTLRSMSDERTRAAAQPGQLAALAAAAAIRSRTPGVIDVPIVDGRVAFPSLGLAQLTRPAGPGGAAVVRTTAAGAEVFTSGACVLIPVDTCEDAPGWRGLRTIAASAEGLTIRLVIDDLDPYRMPAATTVCPRLTPAEVSLWEVALRDAWAILVRHHAAAAEEILSAVTVVVPLPAPAGGQVSATSREHFGCAALSCPIDGVMFAVTLAHEVQHAKLAALLDTVALTLPDDGRRYYAPWRDDPRPITGLLQGTYAYLGVSEFWRRQRHRERGAAAIRAHTEFARWRAAAQLAAGTLTASGSLTARGERFVAGMDHTLGERGKEPVPPAALALARRDARRHWASWLARNGMTDQPS